MAATVFEALPGIRLDRPSRAADFARVLAAVDQVLATDAVAAYGQQSGDLAADEVDSDPVLTAIAEAITEPWTGSAGTLLDLIYGDAEQQRPKDRPKDSRALTRCPRADS